LISPCILEAAPRHSAKGGNRFEVGTECVAADCLSSVFCKRNFISLCGIKAHHSRCGSHGKTLGTAQQAGDTCSDLAAKAMSSVVSRAFDVLRCFEAMRRVSQPRDFQPLRPAAFDGVAPDHTLTRMDNWCIAARQNTASA